MFRIIFVLSGFFWAFAGDAAAQSKFGSFTYAHHTDAFDDTDRSYVMSMSEGTGASIAWKCMEDGLNVLYLIDGKMGGDSDGEVLVRYRVGGLAPSEELYWSLTPEKDMVWMPMNLVSKFTADAKRSAGVVLRVVDPLDNESRQHEFSLDGLSAALTRLPCAK